MAVTSWANLHSTQFTETDLANSAVTIGSKTIYAVELDNTNNTGAPVYFKIWQNASPSVGTTGADEVIEVPASTKLKEVFNGGDGIAFTNATMACVTGAKYDGSTSPTNDVPVKVWTS